MTDPRRFSEEPDDPQAFTERFDRFYSRFARAYDWLVKALPLWKRWLNHALPYVEGPRVLEVSCGTGYLLTRYADRVNACALDLNPRMLDVARENLRKAGVRAELTQGDVERLPYPSVSFDTVVNTMAFSGYPDGHAALSEMIRVLKPAGRLVMIDVGYPADGNVVGRSLAEFWRRAGDLIRDMDSLFREAGLEYWTKPIGGFGSVHLYVATKHSK
jgi:ubiquinone/menaquinone biosynthesis C-methylase UbiE